MNQLIKCVSWFRFLAIFLFIVLMNSCASLKPYERVYVDDPEMQMTLTPGKGFEKYVQSIREGSTEATGAKGNGGCGCN